MSDKDKKQLELPSAVQEGDMLLLFDGEGRVLRKVITIELNGTADLVFYEPEEEGDVR